MSKVARPVETVIIRAWGAVEWVMRASGEVPASDFLSEQPPNVASKFLALVEHLAARGIAGFPAKRFEKIEGNLCAIRCEVNNRQYRFPCFQDGKRWIVTHGFVKPGARNKKLGAWPPQEIERAKRLMGEYFEQMKRLTPKGGGS